MMKNRTKVPLQDPCRVLPANGTLKKPALVLVLTILTAGSVFSLDLQSFPSPIEKGSILISGGFGLGSFYSGWDNATMVGGTLAVDYALPINFALTVGGEIGISGAEVKGGLGDSGFGLVPILVRVAWHPDWGINKLDTYIMLKLGGGIGFWTGDLADSKIDPPSGFMYGFDVGARYFFTDSIGAFVELGYEYAFLTYKYTVPGYYIYPDTTVESVAFGNKFLTIGVTFKLGGAKK